MRVHGITDEAICAGPPADAVDERLRSFLLANGAETDRRVIEPVGWNVVGFDMPFIRHALPRSAELISRRGVDLNAVCRTLDGVIEFEGSRPTTSGWKRLAKRAAALASWEWHRSVLVGRPLNSG